MVDPAIEAFFAENDLSKEEWLPKAAKLAGSRAFATHPSKFSHPDTGVGKKNKKNQTYVTPVICRAPKNADGFLRSGNAKTDEDSETLGDAAALKVDSFLKLGLADGNTLLKHIESDTDLAREILCVKSEHYDSLRKGFLAIIKSPSEIATSSKVKQVYFPVPDGYHQLSLLSNSGMIYELKKRINHMRFSDEVEERRERKRNNLFSDQIYSELFNLTTIAYGGSKPQNISSLNQQNYGKTYLLQSSPPKVNKRKIHFPKHNFFHESFHPYEYREVFDALHKLFKTDYNNLRIREGRDYRLQDLLDRIIGKMWAVRVVCQEQHRPESSHLKVHQKIWLCDEYRQTREEEDSWLDTLCDEISGWTIRTYEKLLGKQVVKLGESERLHVLKIVEENREALR